MRRKSNKLFQRVGLCLAVFVLGISTLPFALIMSSRVLADTNPVIGAVLGLELLDGNGFTPGTPVSIRVFQEQGGTLLYENYNTNANESGWFAHDIADESLSFTPGMYVEITDEAASVTKGLTLQDLAFTGLRIDTDVATGTAPANAAVTINAATAANVCQRELYLQYNPYETIADSNGNWSADLSAQIDITQARVARVSLDEPDGDHTMAEFPGREAPIQFGLYSDELWAADGWDASAEVLVTVCDNETQLYSGAAATDQNGGFSLLRSVHGLDIRAGQRLVVWDNDTRVDMEIVSDHGRTVVASVDSNSITGTDFQPNTQVTIRVYEGEGGALAGEATVTINENGGFEAPDNLAELNIEPGMYVEVYDAAQTKTLKVSDLGFGTLDAASDMASGHAPVGAPLAVAVNTSANPCEGDAFFEFNTAANTSGVWSVDVAAQGGDVLQNRGGSVTLYDEDGDGTRVGFNPRNFDADLRRDTIGAWRGWWRPNATVQVDIYAAGGQRLFTGTAATSTFGGFELTYADHGVNLEPGMRVVVSDADESIDYTLLDAAWDSLDWQSRAGFGHAPAGTIPCAEGYIDYANGETGKGLRPITINPVSNWTLDFTWELHEVVGGTLGFRLNNGAATMATYLPAGQGVADLAGIVATLVEQDQLTSQQGLNLRVRLLVVGALIRANLDNPAVSAMQGFNRQVDRYVGRGQLAEQRGDKLTDDSNAVIAVIRDN